jgi:tubulin--tyrosine ligase
MHQFHLRAYCFAIGTLRVYLYDRILALFSSAPYRSPGDDDTPNTDLSPHLTNTCLQTHRGEEGVRLFTELVGCRILTLDTQVDDSPPEFTHDDIEMIIGQISEILAETFKAALQMSVHFQVS